MFVDFKFSDSQFSHSFVSHLTVLGCTLSVINQSAVVDSRTKSLISAEPDAIKTQSLWQTWDPPQVGPGGSPIVDPQVDAVSNAEERIFTLG